MSTDVPAQWMFRHITADVEVTLPDGMVYENNFMDESELELCQFVQSIADKLTDVELEKLSKLVEEYGSSKYSEGSADCERQHSYY